jgi:hypothetical protein
MNQMLPIGAGYPDEAVGLFPHYEDEVGTSPEAIAGVADGVRAYNKSVDGLRSEYAERQAEIMARTAMSRMSTTRTARPRRGGLR